MSTDNALQYDDLPSVLLNAPLRMPVRVERGLLLKRYKPAEFSDAEWFWRWPDISFKMQCYGCHGERTFSGAFAHDIGEVPRKPKWLAMIFKCRDCQQFERVFTVRYHSDAPQPDDPTCAEGYTMLPLTITNISVFPGLAPGPTKAVKKLLGAFEPLFLKGVACEAQGLGVGAFAYYRQIVEGLKDQIFDTLIELVDLEGGPSKDALIEGLRAHKTSFQFKNAADYAKDVLPESVRIAGHNPLGLLYQKLSEGIHSSSDEECLDIAKHIRAVLVALPERLAQSLKAERELVAAVGSLHGTSRAKGQ